MGDQVEDLLKEMKEMANKQFAVHENKTLDLDIEHKLQQSDYQQGEQSAEKEKENGTNILDDSNLRNDDEKQNNQEEDQQQEKVADNQFNQENGENLNEQEGQQDQKERRKLRQYKTGYKDDNQSSDQQSEQSRGAAGNREDFQRQGSDNNQRDYNRNNRDDQQRGYGRGYGRGNNSNRGGYRGYYANNRGYDRGNDYGNQRENNRNDNQRYRDDNSRYGQDGRGQQRSDGYNYGSYQSSNHNRDDQQRSDYRNQYHDNRYQRYDQRQDGFDNRNAQRQDYRQELRYNQREVYRQDTQDRQDRQDRQERKDYRYNQRQDNYKQNYETDYQQDNYRSQDQKQEYQQDYRQVQRQDQRSNYYNYETNDNRNKQSFKSNLSYQNQDRYEQQISKFQENDYSQQRQHYQSQQKDQEEKVYLVDQTILDETFILDQDREIKLVDKKFETNDTFIPNDFSKDFLTNGPLKQVYHFRTEFLRLASYHNINDIRQKIPSCGKVNQQHKFSENDKFLLARPKTGDFNLHKAIKYGIWTFMEKRISTVQKAYKENNNVYLIFLPHAGSKQEFMIRGLAKIVSNFNHDKHFQFWDKELSYFGVFHIEWLYVKNVPTRRIPKFTYQSNNKLCQCEISDLQDCSDIYWDDARSVLRELINAPDYPSLFDFFSAFDIQEDTTRYERTKSSLFTERLKEESDKFESRYKKQYR